MVLKYMYFVVGGCGFITSTLAFRALEETFHKKINNNNNKRPFTMYIAPVSAKKSLVGLDRENIIYNCGVVREKIFLSANLCILKSTDLHNV